MANNQTFRLVFDVLGELQLLSIKFSSIHHWSFHSRVLRQKTRERKIKSNIEGSRKIRGFRVSKKEKYFIRVHEEELGVLEGLTSRVEQ